MNGCYFQVDHKVHQIGLAYHFSLKENKGFPYNLYLSQKLKRKYIYIYKMDKKSLEGLRKPNFVECFWRYFSIN